MARAALTVFSATVLTRALVGFVGPMLATRATAAPSVPSPAMKHWMIVELRRERAALTTGTSAPMIAATAVVRAPTRLTRHRVKTAFSATVPIPAVQVLAFTLATRASVDQSARGSATKELDRASIHSGSHVPATETPARTIAVTVQEAAHTPRTQTLATTAIPAARTTSVRGVFAADNELMLMAI